MANFIERIAEACLAEPAIKVIGVRPGYVQLLEWDKTVLSGNAYELGTKLRDILKKAGIDTGSPSWQSCFFNCTFAEREEAMPADFKEVSINLTKMREDMKEKHNLWQKKRKGAIANAQMLAAKKFDASEEGKAMYDEYISARNQVPPLEKKYNELIPDFLKGEMRIELRD